MPSAAKASIKLVISSLYPDATSTFVLQFMPIFATYSHNMKIYEDLLSKVAEALKRRDYSDAPGNLTAPVDYILSNGGKRIRPLVCLLACELCGADAENALPAAIAVEIFHNFSLMHDDVMDEAPIRRGKAAVHHQYDLNAAILSGDFMLVHAYQNLQQLEPQIIPKALQIFNDFAAGVCFGQQLDMDFEQRMDVQVEEYLRMIELKTSVLLAGSMQLGALVAGASEQDQIELYEFGRNVGLAFQLQDDILDTFGEQHKFGKQKGGDIIQNKKTYLLIKALETEQYRDELSQWLDKKDFDPREKVEAVTSLYQRLGLRAKAEQLMEQYLETALASLANVSASEELKKPLHSLALQLMKREN